MPRLTRVIGGDVTQSDSERPPCPQLASRQLRRPAPRRPPGPVTATTPCRAMGGHLGLGRRRGVSDRDGRVRVQPRTAAALHCDGSAGGQHRPGPPDALRRPRLAAVRVGARRLRPQQGSGHLDRAAHDVALAGRRRPVAVLRHDADGVVAGASEAALAAMVGSRHQLRLHVVLHPAVRGRCRAVAARPR